MPVESTVQEELKQIQQHHFDPDRESPDPILRLFAKQHLAAGARLRVLYARRLAAEADVKRLNEKIDAAGQELHRLRATHLAQWEQPSIETEMPSDAESIDYARATSKAALLHGLLEAWKAQVGSYQLKLNDAGKEWQTAYDIWRNLLWRLTGESDVQPSWVMVDRHIDANGWHKPEGYELGTLEATRAQLEA